MPTINLNNPGTSQDFTMTYGIPFKVSFENSSGPLPVGVKAYLAIEFLCEAPYYPPRPQYPARNVKYIGDTDVRLYIDPLPEFYFNFERDTITWDTTATLPFNTAKYELILIFPPSTGFLVCRKYRPLFGTITQAQSHTNIGKTIGMECKS